MVKASRTGNLVKIRKPVKTPRPVKIRKPVRIRKPAQDLQRQLKIYKRVQDSKSFFHNI